jgi:hypothetical protein
MKEKLKDKISKEGNLAQELVASEGYQLISKKMSQRKEFLLQEALSSKSFDQLQYFKGFIEGLEVFESSVKAMISRFDAQRKQN